MRKVIFLSIISLILIVTSAMGFEDVIAIQTSGGSQAFDGSNPVVVDNRLTVTGGLIEDAKVTINNVMSGDVLGYNASILSGVSASYDASKGILSFSGTVNAAKWQTLLRTVTFSGSTIGEREITFTIGNAVTFEGKEHFYEYVPEGLIWVQANEAAFNRTLYGLRGYLATVTSSDENAFILSILGSDAWLGASDDYTIINSVVDVPYIDQNAAEGHWYWVTGPEAGQKFSTGNETPVTEAGQFSYWYSSEPNNNAGDENFGHIIAPGVVSQGHWNDGAFTHIKHGYVVEYGGMEGDPDIILQDSRSVVSPPAPPVSISAVAGDESATVSYAAPSNNGGSVVTSYTVTTSTGVLMATGTRTSITVTGLTNGTTYAFTVTATNAAGTSAASSVSSSITPNAKDLIATVDGEEHVIGHSVLLYVNGMQTVQMMVDPEVLSDVCENLEDDPQEPYEMQFTVPQNSVRTEMRLTGLDVDIMEHSGIIMRISAPSVEYFIPSREIDIMHVAELLGSPADALENIRVDIEKTRIFPSDLDIPAEMTVVGSSMEFTITASVTKADGTVKEVTIDTFKAPVGKIFSMPAGTNSSQITTGIVHMANGSVAHIPTNVYYEGETLMARINSMTNSVYSMITHHVDVPSVTGHWSESMVDEMASRLVITEPESFNPDLAITREAYADYITRALGIFRSDEKYEMPFSDVDDESPYAQAVAITKIYGIFEGYGDATFGPNDQLTREQAMVVTGRVMDVLKMKAEGQVDMSKFSDRGDISPWAQDEVQRVVNAKLFVGTSADTLSPQGTLSHAEAIVSLRNLLIESLLIDER